MCQQKVNRKGQFGKFKAIYLIALNFTSKFVLVRAAELYVLARPRIFRCLTFRTPLIEKINKWYVQLAIIESTITVGN